MVVVAVVLEGVEGANNVVGVSGRVVTCVLVVWRMGG